MKIAIVIDSFDIINDNSLIQDFGNKLDHDKLMFELRIDKDIDLHEGDFNFVKVV